VSQGGGWFAIQDQVRLAELVRRSVTERFGGSQRRAARELAGSAAPQLKVYRFQRLINRLARGKTGRVTWSTKRLIYDLVGPDRHEELRQTLLTPEARVRLARYRRWLQRELSRTRMSQYLEQRLRRKHWDPFQHFDHFLERMAHITPRAHLALREILAPLARDRVTGGIELGVSDLSPTDLGRYLRHAFAAQRVLLRRPPDLARATHAAEAESIIEKALQATAEKQAVRTQRRRHPVPRPPPNALGRRVRGGQKRAKPTRRTLPELTRLLRRCQSLESLNKLVDEELDRTEPRRKAIETLLEVARRLEGSRSRARRRLTNELTTVRESLGGGGPIAS
jgi:hypothetical protein